MKYWLRKTVRLVPHTLRWRLGRALYMDARGEIPNVMATNGEVFLQHCAVQAWLKHRAAGEPMVVFDIGANQGDWTASLLQQINDASITLVKIFAFEPDPDAYSLLSSRFGADRRVTVEQACLSSQRGQATLYRCGPAFGTNSLHAADQGCMESMPIPTDTLDDYCARQGIQQIAFAKCDTEGHDFEVITGAMHLLRAGAISIFQFEYNFRWIYARRFLRDVFESIQALPYRLGKIQTDHVVIFDQWHFELERYFEGNYVLLHHSARGWVPTKTAAWDSSNVMRLADQ
jgi:FkbM family methyltransferase